MGTNEIVRILTSKACASARNGEGCRHQGCHDALEAADAVVEMSERIVTIRDVADDGRQPDGLVEAA